MNPHLLFPSDDLFLNADGKACHKGDNACRPNYNANKIVNNFDTITQNEFDELLDGVKKLKTNPFDFDDFQKIIFGADYNVSLTPKGFLGESKWLGQDLYNELAKPRKNHTKFQPNGTKIIIQQINSSENIMDYSQANIAKDSREPIIFISSPYSIAKALSNIAKQGDRRKYKSGYMISYAPEADYETVVSGQIKNRENKISTRIFYPLPYANTENSIKLTTSTKDDFVLYDNTHEDIYLADGDDTTAPSAAAFLPSIQFGKNVIDNMKGQNSKGKYGPGYPESGAIHGYPLVNGNINYPKNTATPSSKPKLILNPYRNYFDKKEIKTEAQRKYTKDEYAKKTDILEAKPDNPGDRPTIKVGGQKIYGESGNDTLYGFDPLLYADMSAIETISDRNPWFYNSFDHPSLAYQWKGGPLNLKFLDNSRTDIKWSNIQLSGGSGQDTFVLGDLGKINLGRGAVSVDTLYTILGDKKNIDDVVEHERREVEWGKNMGADEIQLTAHYEATEEVIQKGINIDYSQPGKNSSDWATEAQKGTKLVKGLLDVGKMVGKTYPQLSNIITVVNLGLDIAKLFQKKKPAPTDDFYQEEKKEKVVLPGNWNNAISFADWDPLDRITVQTIPVEDPDVIQRDSWRNINFSIIPENNQSMSPFSYGLTLQMETQKGNKQPIAYLPGLKNTGGQEFGWETYDFFKNQTHKINPFEDINYFGVLSNTEAAKKIQSKYTEPEYRNLEIDENNGLFLWNTQAFKQKGLLEKYRSAASSIQIGVDSRKFGWYTDLKLKDEKTINYKSSTFNYYDSKGKKWVAVSLEELKDSSSDSPEARNAEKARFTYWTTQDTHGDQLMNLSAADADHSNDLEFYKSKDNGSVLDPVTGEWLAPSDPNYEQAALSEDNYGEAFSVKQLKDGSIKYKVERGYKLSPFIETTFDNGKVDYIFAYDDVHANDPNHEKDSMVIIADSNVVRFEDEVGGDYDYDDAVLDRSLHPELGSHLASEIFS